MVDPQQSRWRPTRRQLLWAAGVAALAFLIIVVCGYLFGWKWTGLPKQTLWDWLDLLIVPVVLALGGYLFTRFESQRTQQNAEKQRDLDRKIANERTETDRHIADQRRQDDTLQAYLDQIGQLLLDKDRPLRESQEGDEGRTLARARTLTVLTRLAETRKAQVVQFLHESDLIAADRPVLKLGGADLSGADLSGADLRMANLYDADLHRATLRQADLRRANLGFAVLIDAGLHMAKLRQADLSYAILIRADLSETDLHEANLGGSAPSGADLSGADLSEADLSGAVLSEADLSGALGWTEEQLSEATTLEGATMPDGPTLRGAKTPNGPTFKDWLKDKKAREEGGQNE